MFNALIITSNTSNALALLAKFYLLPDKKVDWLWPQREMAQLCPILWCVLRLFHIPGYSFIHLSPAFVFGSRSSLM